MTVNFGENKLVTVVMSRNDCFGLGLSLRFAAEILHVAVDTGDLWHFLVCLEDRRVIIAVNPMSTDFIGIVVPLKRGE